MQQPAIVLGRKIGVFGGSYDIIDQNIIILFKFEPLIEPLRSGDLFIDFDKGLFIYHNVEGRIECSIDVVDTIKDLPRCE